MDWPSFMGVMYTGMTKQQTTAVPASPVRWGAYISHISSPLDMASDCLLPGQPVPLPRGPLPQLGSGIYTKDGQPRASLVGIPRYDASVGFSYF